MYVFVSEQPLSADGVFPEGYLGGRPVGHHRVHVQGERERGTDPVSQLPEDCRDAADQGTQRRGRQAGERGTTRNMGGFWLAGRFVPALFRRVLLIFV